MWRSLLKRVTGAGVTSGARSGASIEALEGRRMLSTSPVASLLVPAYFYPVAGGDWDRMATAAKSVPVTAILNPDSGPGKTADPVYAAAVNKLRGSGGRIVGYVHTSYGKRSLTAAEAEARTYKSFYHVDGIFVDEMATDSAHVSYYHSLYAFIKKLNSGFEVIGNPGTDTKETYLTAPAADVLVDFEDNQNGLAGGSPSSWVRNHASSHFGNIVGEAAGIKTMTADLSLARQRNAGYVYVTDQNINDDNHAYERLPVYWSQEVAAVKAENGH